MNYGLGRLHAPDPKDADYKISTLPQYEVSERTSRFWYAYYRWLNQGNTSECVAYSWEHFYTDSPTTHKTLAISPDDLYNEAQKVDEWPGEDYDGTSVRAGAKVLQSRGIIGSYHWAYDVDTITNCILEQGPVIVGTNWYNSMFRPDPKGYLVITQSTLLAGGHAYKLDGVNKVKEFFRMKNSWGRDWEGSHNGFARISFSTMERLLNENGEACLALEAISA